MSRLSAISIKGYKSIGELDRLQLTNLNILLGANGAGKSNFISVFKFLANAYQQNLQGYVAEQGGPDALLHYGRKKSPEMHLRFEFDLNAYDFTLKPTIDNRLIFKQEQLCFLGGDTGWGYRSPSAQVIQKGSEEAELNESSHTYARYIKPAIESWRVYHFHDTSETAAVKQLQAANDNLRFKPDAANLVAFLQYLQEHYLNEYKQIISTIRLVAPFFVDFVQRPKESFVELEWFEKGNPDTPFKAHVLSDGTLRFMCLATLLLQPFELMSDTLLIDEPELGLHPYALTILAALIKRAAERKQLIIATQSVELVNHFNAEDLIVVDRVNNASTFKRLDHEKLQHWLEDYSLGDLWLQNILGGRPA